MSRVRQWYTLLVFVVLASLDNAAVGLMPPLYGIIATDLEVSEAAISWANTCRIAVAAMSALVWGYYSDRWPRKRLLVGGTLIWAIFLGATGLAQSFWQLLLAQIVTAIGIGCIFVIGISLINDFIPPHRRGLAMSVWGIAQGGGWAVGAMGASILGTVDWRVPFLSLAAIGFLFAFLYLFTTEPARGSTQPELADLFASGGDYGYRIDLDQARQLWQNRSNRWLIIQRGLSAIGYGTAYWLPLLFAAKVSAEGYSLAVATIAGSMFMMLFQEAAICRFCSVILATGGKNGTCGVGRCCVRSVHSAHFRFKFSSFLSP